MKLVLSRGQIISRDELFKLVNVKDGGYNSRTVDNHIKKIRTFSFECNFNSRRSNQDSN